MSESENRTKQSVLGLVLQYIARKLKHSNVESFCSHYCDQSISLEEICNFYHDQNREECNQAFNNIIQKDFAVLNTLKKHCTKNEAKESKGHDDVSELSKSPSLEDIVTPFTEGFEGQLEDSSILITCEEALFAPNSKEKSTSFNKRKIRDNVSMKIMNKCNLPSMNQFSPKSTHLNAKEDIESIEEDFKQLLNCATTTPKRLYRNDTKFNPVMNSNEVYCNKSAILKLPNNGTIHSSNEYMLDLQNMADLNHIPKEGDVIAFKLLELSDDYTPVVSDYKIGKVTKIYTQTNSMKIKLNMPQNKDLKMRSRKFELPDSMNTTEPESSSEKVFKMSELYYPKKVL